MYIALHLGYLMVLLTELPTGQTVFLVRFIIFFFNNTYIMFTHGVVGMQLNVHYFQAPRFE